MAFGRKKSKGGGSGRIGQLVEAFHFTRKQDPAVTWVLLASALGPFLVLLGLGLAIDRPWMLGLLGLTTGVLVAMVVFGRRAERAAFAQVEGQPGAAAAALNLLRRGWTVSPAVAVTRNQDIVHRVVGRPGIILVGEGAPSRVSNLLSAEKRKVGRVAPEVPVHEILAGNGEGQVPLRKLSRKVQKLPRALTAAQVNELNFRLKALDTQRGQLPIPKGPMPKGARVPRAPR